MMIFKYRPKFLFSVDLNKIDIHKLFGLYIRKIYYQFRFNCCYPSKFFFKLIYYKLIIFDTI